MNLTLLVAALRRRWYVAVAGLVLTSAAGVLAFLLVPPSYTSATSLLLIPPATTVGPRGNPYLNLGGLGPAVDVLATRVLAGQTAQQIIDDNPDATIAVGPDFASTGPILLVKVEAPSAGTSMSLRDAIVAEVAPTLARMQGDVSVGASSRITTSSLATDPRPEVSRKSQLRALIVAVGGGLAATVFGSALIDGVALRRSGVAALGGADTTPVARVPKPTKRRRQADWSWSDDEPVAEPGPAEVAQVPVAPVAPPVAPTPAMQTSTSPNGDNHALDDGWVRPVRDNAEADARA